MSMEPQWNDTDGETEELEQTPLLVPLCALQIPHGLAGTLFHYNQ